MSDSHSDLTENQLPAAREPSEEQLSDWRVLHRDAVTRLLRLWLGPSFLAESQVHNTSSEDKAR